jgi:dTMP kinase
MVDIKRHQQKGRLIAVEGLDGSGKSTQIYLLKRWLELEGYKVFFTEWNSSFLVKSATKKAKKLKLLTPTTFSLIHATDFADRYERQIWPLLCAGYIVLADRYFFTAFARDVTRGCDPDWVKNLYSFATLPDVTFFFRVDPAVAIGRILDGRPELKYHEAGMDLNLSSDPYESFRIFQGRINEAYEDMINPFGFTVIDSNRQADVMQAEVRALVKECIDLPAFKLRSKVQL